MSWDHLGGGLYVAPLGEPLPVPTDDLERQVDPLRWMVKNLRYKPGWRFDVTLPQWPDYPSRSRRYLRVEVDCIDSVTKGNTTIIHQIAVPEIYELRRQKGDSERFLRRWLLEAIIGIERHEACEFFTLAGAKPFFPPHNDGHDPYVVRELPEDEWPR